MLVAMSRAGGTCPFILIPSMTGPRASLNLDEPSLRSQVRRRDVCDVALRDVCVCVPMDKDPKRGNVFAAAAAVADALGSAFGAGGGGAIDDCGAVDICMGVGVVMRV